MGDIIGKIYFPADSCIILYEWDSTSLYCINHATQESVQLYTYNSETGMMEGVDGKGEPFPWDGSFISFDKTSFAGGLNRCMDYWFNHDTIYRDKETIKENIVCSYRGRLPAYIFSFIP